MAFSDENCLIREEFLEIKFDIILFIRGERSSGHERGEKKDLRSRNQTTHH